MRVNDLGEAGGVNPSALLFRRGYGKDSEC